MMNDTKAIAMFGCTEPELEAGIFSMIERFPPQQAISILSDAQELIDHGEMHTARQYINRVKRLLSKMPRPDEALVIAKNNDWAIYDHNNLGVATVKAESEGQALDEFAKQQNVPDHQLDCFWAERLDA